MGFFINTSSSDNITDEDRENLKKLDDVAEKMKDLDEGLEKINNTTDEINNLKDNKADANHTHQYTDIENAPNLEDYASKDYVTREIEKVETIKGDKGDKGDTGDKGQDGLSAYEIAKNKGFVGDESQWLESLKGDKGDKGDTGDTGKTGEKGDNGITPSLKIGTTTTLDSGSNATVTMTNNNNVYTINFGIPKGEKGEGGSGSTGEVDLSNYATKTYVDTKIDEIQPLKGDKGDSGENGLSAYEIAKNKGFTGDETQWLASLKGAKGETGEKGEDGTFNIEATYTKLETTDKTVLGAINEVFTSASNGKKLIAQAITGKGVETSESDTFATMAQNINNIPTGSGGGITQDELDFLNSIKNRNSLAYLFTGDARSSITNIFDTSRVTNMNSMFYDCLNLTTIPQFDTSRVTNMYNMFYNCSKLTTIPQFDTSRVTNMNSMFYNCSSLTTIPQLNTSSVTSVAYMFYNCSKLTTIPQFDTSRVTNMNSMFYNCSSLTTIPQLDTSRVTNMNEMFYNCSKLTTIRFNPDVNNIVSFSIKNCIKMTTEDLTGMIESLPTITNSVKITMGSTLISRISEEAMDILLGKGYTVA